MEGCHAQWVHAEYIENNVCTRVTNCFSAHEWYFYPGTMKLLGGILVSLRPSVCPSVPHPVSALKHLQFWLDPFHIYTYYQATSEGVLCVKFLAKISKLEVLAIFLNLQLWLCHLLTWDLMLITGMCKHGAARGISECRRSSCPSLVFISRVASEHRNSLSLEYIHYLIFYTT